MYYVYKWRFIFGGFRLGTQERGGLQTTGNRVNSEREVAWCLGGFHVHNIFIEKRKQKQGRIKTITFLWLLHSLSTQLLSNNPFPLEHSLRWGGIGTSVDKVNRVAAGGRGIVQAKQWNKQTQHSSRPPTATFTYFKVFKTTLSYNLQFSLSRNKC